MSRARCVLDPVGSPEPYFAFKGVGLPVPVAGHELRELGMILEDARHEPSPLRARQRANIERSSDVDIGLRRRLRPAESLLEDAQGSPPCERVAVAEMRLQ
jgi:hypothetical protein